MRNHNYFIKSSIRSSVILCLLLVGIQGLAQEVSFGSSGLIGEYTINPTSLDFGSDGKLYVSEQSGSIWQFEVARDGAEAGLGSYSVVSSQKIDLIKSGVPNHTDDGTATMVKKRQVTGIFAAGTPTAPVLYVTSSDNLIGGGGGGDDKNLDTNSSMLSRLTWNGTEWNKVDLVRGLPRSEENHSLNGMDTFVRNGTTYMLMQQGGHTNNGAPSNNFAGTPEYLLSAAILIVNLTQLEAMPIYTDPRSGTSYVYDLPTLNDPDREDITNTDARFPYSFQHPLYNATIDVGDPFGGNDGLNQAFPESGGPVQVFSPGYRNGYDLVVTQNGRIYTYDNGPNSGWGGFPVIYRADGTRKGDESNTTYNPENGDYVIDELNESGSIGHGDLLHYVGTTADPNGTYYGGHPIPVAAFPDKADLIVYKNTGGHGRSRQDIHWPVGLWAYPVILTATLALPTFLKMPGREIIIRETQPVFPGCAFWTLSTPRPMAYASIRPQILAVPLREIYLPHLLTVPLQAINCPRTGKAS